MRIFITALLAIFLTIAAVSAFAQSTKSICVPIKFNQSTVDPNLVPESYLGNMTLLRQNGTFAIGVSLCQTHTLKACGEAPGYVAIADRNGTCIGAFNEVLSRPTATSTGFTVVYGSTLSKNNNDAVQIQVVCNPTAPASLTSLSHKFMVGPYKTGGVIYRFIAYSAAACESKPIPPPSPDATCRAFHLGKSLVNPLSWQPVALNLAVGFTGNVNWLFSLCSASPAPMPPQVPSDCANTGYLTRFNDTNCNGAFNIMSGFKVYSTNVVILKYETTMVDPQTGHKVVAFVSVACQKGATQLVSIDGTYSRTTVNNTIQLLFKLGHNDMCAPILTTKPIPSTVPPRTLPTRVTLPPRTLPPRTLPTFTRPSGNHTEFPHPSNWTKPTGNWTHPSDWTRPSGNHTEFPHPSDWTRPTGNHTEFPHPSNWTRPTGNHTYFPHPTGNWTHPSGNWTHPSNWTHPTGNHTYFPHPTGNWTHPSGNWTHPSNWTRPAGNHTEFPYPTGNWTRPTGNWTKPTSNWTRPSGEWTKPTGESTKPTGESTKPTGESTKPSDSVATTTA